MFFTNDRAILGNCDSVVSHLWGPAFKDVIINGKKCKALFDAGFKGEVLVSPKVAKEIGLKVLEGRKDYSGWKES